MSPVKEEGKEKMETKAFNVIILQIKGQQTRAHKLFLYGLWGKYGFWVLKRLFLKKERKAKKNMQQRNCMAHKA